MVIAGSVWKTARSLLSNFATWEHKQLSNLKASEVS